MSCSDFELRIFAYKCKCANHAVQTLLHHVKADNCPVNLQRVNGCHTCCLLKALLRQQPCLKQTDCFQLQDSEADYLLLCVTCEKTQLQMFDYPDILLIHEWKQLKTPYLPENILRQHIVWKCASAKAVPSTFCCPAFTS